MRCCHLHGKSISSTCLKNAVKKVVTENYRSISVISKILVNSLLIFWFQVMVLGFFVQVLTLSQLYLIESGSGLWSRATKVFSFFLCILAIDNFVYSWMKNLRKSSSLMMIFPKAPFLAMHFYCRFMLFLTIFSVVLLSLLIILLITVGGIECLISGNS